MERQSFLQWLSDPLSMDAGSLADLQQLIREYPYFQTARVLFTLNLQLLNDYRFEGELRRCSAYSADRAKLRDWISHINHHVKSKAGVISTPEIKAPVSEKPEKEKALHEVEEQIRLSLRQIELNQEILKELIGKKKEITGAVEQHDTPGEGRKMPHRSLPKDELLDEFIAGWQQGQKEKAFFFSPEESARRSIEENDGILSETLARLVAAQGKIEKAIKIYQRLMLKNPQKSSYFAAQIEKLKKEL